ncbi:MAG: hypothetical protein HYY40_10600 [Bacteroidetes bacterium]|nr:hypothetical protein [Bacteroidota bacterium]
MAGGKLTPRQKMINMMYLVLTALLALNVQKSVLDAFAVIDETLNKTIETFMKKNAMVYEEFQKQAAQNPDKAGPWKRKADEVRKRADQMQQYINDLKIKLVKKVDGVEDEKEKLDSTGTRIDAWKIEAKDNQDIGGEVMIVYGEGAKLKEEMKNFREFMVSMIKAKDEDIKISIMRTLATNNPPYDPELGTVTWESQLFEHLPFIAVIANSTQLQSAVRYAESEMITYLMKEVTGEDIPFNKVDAIVIPKSNYVTKGDSFSADIFQGHLILYPL